MRYLTLEEILFIHQDQIEAYGGATDIRDIALLESALAQPSASFDSVDLHVTVFDKAAAYLFHICSNHPFLDGNKRTALASALVFLALNGITIDDSEDRLYDAVMQVASGNSSKEILSDLFRQLDAK